MSRFLRTTTNKQTMEFVRATHFTDEYLKTMITTIENIYASKYEADPSDVYNDTESTEAQLLSLLSAEDAMTQYSLFLLLNNLETFNIKLMTSYFDEDDKYLTMNSLMKYILDYDNVHRFRRKMEIYDLLKRKDVQYKETANGSFLDYLENGISFGTGYRLFKDGLIFTPVINNIIDTKTAFRNTRTAIKYYLDLAHNTKEDMTITMNTDLGNDMLDRLISNMANIILPLEKSSMFSKQDHHKIYNEVLGNNQKITKERFLVQLDKFIDNLVDNAVEDEFIESSLWEYIQDFNPSDINSMDDIDKRLFCGKFIDGLNVQEVQADMTLIRQYLIEMRTKLKEDVRFEQIIEEEEASI